MSQELGPTMRIEPMIALYTGWVICPLIYENSRRARLAYWEQGYDTEFIQLFKERLSVESVQENPERYSG